MPPWQHHNINITDDIIIIIIVYVQNYDSAVLFNDIHSFNDIHDLMELLQSCLQDACDSNMLHGCPNIMSVSFIFLL